MKRLAVLMYGIVCYGSFLGVFLYAVGFVGNLWVPKSIDSPATAPLFTSLLINSLLLGLFAVQHSIMARPWFKKKIAAVIPAAAERSTFVLMTNVVFVLLFWQWRPIPELVWQVTSPVGATALHVLFWAGWGMVLVSTFLIDHFELFGLRQVFAYFRGREFRPPKFTEAGAYAWVRHPIMLGFIIAFWATPAMSVGHLFFAALSTGYIFVGVLFEERDLRRHHGEHYVQYARRVPMLIPGLKRNRSKREDLRRREVGVASQSE